MKFYQCTTSNSIFLFPKNSTKFLECCGNSIQELIPNSTEASLEKHIPIVEQLDRHILIKVSSKIHPMLPEHYIEWILLETTFGFYQKNLQPGEAPMAEFVLTPGEEVLTSYAYCNIHKLWQS